MVDRIREVEGDRDNCLYAKIGLVYSQTWPGQVYLRFEPFGSEASQMIRVMPGDIISISNLAGPYITDEEAEGMRNKVLRQLAMMGPSERSELLSKHRHPSGM